MEVCRFLFFRLFPLSFCLIFIIHFPSCYKITWFWCNGAAEPPHLLGKRKAAAVEESTLRARAAMPTKLYRTRRLQPSTSLRLDLNRQQPSNSFEANSSAMPPDLLGAPKSRSYLSLLNEDEDEDDDGADDDQFSVPLPQYVRERINRMDQIIKQQVNK